MGTAILWFVIIFVGLGVVSKSFNSISKSGQKMHGHNRCEECNSRLKAVNGKYAGVCSKCAHQQSWA